MLRRIFGPKRNKVTGVEKTTCNIIWVIKLRRMRWAGYIACMEKRRGAYRVLVGKREGKRPLGRPRQRWEDNIIWICRSGMRGHGLDWSGSGLGKVADTCKCGNEPLGSMQRGEFLD
jgi:hypothetical protein